MIKKSILCGIQVASLTYEPTIALTGGAFVGMVDETDPEMIQNIVQCLQGTLSTLSLEQAAMMPKPTRTSACKPMIFIAPEAVEMLSPEELMFIIQHEQGHIHFNHIDEMTEAGVEMLSKPEDMGNRHEIEADTYAFHNCTLTGAQCVEALKKMLRLSLRTANCVSQSMEVDSSMESISESDIDEFMNHMFSGEEHFGMRAANLLSLVR